MIREGNMETLFTFLLCSTRVIRRISQDNSVVCWPSLFVESRGVRNCQKIFEQHIWSCGWAQLVENRFGCASIFGIDFYHENHFLNNVFSSCGSIRDFRGKSIHTTEKDKQRKISNSCGGVQKCCRFRFPNGGWKLVKKWMNHRRRGKHFSKRLFLGLLWRKVFCDEIFYSLQVGHPTCSYEEDATRFARAFVVGTRSSTPVRLPMKWMYLVLTPFT